MRALAILLLKEGMSLMHNGQVTNEKRKNEIGVVYLGKMEFEVFYIHLEVGFLDVGVMNEQMLKLKCSLEFGDNIRLN
jgi:predicted glutamine amidotransferase